MNNFFTRALSGLVFVVILMGCVFYSQFSFLTLFFVITMGGLYEYFKMVRNYGVAPNMIFGYITAALIFAATALSGMFLPYEVLIYLIPVFVFWIFIAELYTQSEKPFLNIASTIAGLVYVAVSLSLFVMFAYVNGFYEWQLAAGFLILQWSSDTGQYCSGMLLGKRKLFERISPKKSWEGFIGGLIFTVAIGYVVSLFYVQLPAWQWMSIALLIVVFGTFGDLVESLLKRSVNVKDSGSIMPGHGGFLDRFDALLGSAPFVYAFVKIASMF